MSSSRSIAAARARRANEQAPPVSGNRPGTSINSHSAFAGQYQSSPNIRVAKSQNGASIQQQNRQQQQYSQQQQKPVIYENGLPFTKLTVSDAIGLITLRLGSVEQFIIDYQHEHNGREHSNNNTSSLNIPENSKIIDNSVLTSIINRLDSLEKRENVSGSVSSSVDIEQINEDITKLKELVQSLNTENTNQLTKQNLLISQHTEQLYKYNRDTVELKDLLKSLNAKFDSFVKDTNDRFTDYEYAVADLEKMISGNNGELNDGLSNDNINLILETEAETDGPLNNEIISADLKSLIKQEFSNT